MAKKTTVVNSKSTFEVDFSATVLTPAGKGGRHCALTVMLHQFAAIHSWGSMCFEPVRAAPWQIELAVFAALRLAGLFFALHLPKAHVAPPCRVGKRH